MDINIPPPISPEDLLQASRAQQLRKLVEEQERRSREALRLFEPLPMQEEFLASKVKKRIVFGSNRGGKTTPTMIEIARAATGQDPHDKYPKENGKAIVVGKDEDHIGGVFFRKLFKPGAFYIIRDEVTRQWRAYRPATDYPRESERKPAPPLIPERFIKGGYKGIAWKNKKKNVIGRVELTTGWEIKFYSSLGKPPQGIDVDLAVFDEEIEDPDWYTEISFRLGDRKGRFIWSATPQNGTEELRALAELAEVQRDSPNPDVASFKISVFDNPHFPKAELEANIREWASNPEQYKIRIEGEFATSSYMIFPDFAPSLHGFDEVGELTPDGVTFDNRWNYYMVVDPGKTICAVSFWAVPPADHHLADQRFLYDELYIAQCNTERFADAVEAKVGGRQFSAFLIDPSAMKHDSLGGGRNVFQQYGDALNARRVRSVQTGSSFLPGGNNIQAGILKVQSWLFVNPTTNRPRFQYNRARCPNVRMEMLKYRKKKVGGQWVDTPVDKDNHLIDTIRYFAMLDPKWETPPKPKAYNRVYEMFRQLQEKEAAREQSNGIHLGPGSASYN